MSQPFAGQRMPELEAITLLEQANGKRRMLRFYSSRICIVADYRKNPGEFLFFNLHLAASQEQVSIASSQTAT